ncbi:MAG TPA: class I SAM-dependent methyltransferase [Crocinitomix sp.]|nr:class I SAM-dependent methyltransferase [Crocinitomix sp.]
MAQTVKELHSTRSKMWDASIDSHSKYIDADTGIFLEEFTEERLCPVCKSGNELEMFYKEGGRYVKCQDCTMVYINPVFKDSALKDYYESNHAVQSEIVESDPNDFYVNIYNQGLDAITNNNSQVLNILDVGCSSGTFLTVAKKRNIKTYGVELNKTEVKLAEKKGHQVYNDLLENITFKEKFDAITLWDVFEHLKSGKFYLSHIKTLLNKKGVIFLQIPSADSLAAKILQEKCNMFDGLEHVNLYGVSTIKKLSESCGLEVLNIQTVISEIGVINNYLNFEDPYLGNTTNKEFIPTLIDEETLHRNLQGYKLQVVLGVKS